MTRRPARAFTLVEAAMSVVVVGVMLVASTATFGTVAKMRASQAEGRLGVMLAQQLMTEIQQCPYERSTTLFGPLAGQARAAFDAVDCYDGYAATPPVSQSGAALTDYAGWTQTAAVSFIDPAAPASTPAYSTLKQITVTVTAPSKRAYTLVGYRSKFGAYECPPTTQATYVTGVSVSLQPPPPARTVYGGAHPLNLQTSQ